MVAKASRMKSPNRLWQVRVLSASAKNGLVQAGSQLFRCALGHGGVRARKREGDGATPRGTWPVRHLLYRRDQISRPATPLPTRAIRPDGGWCDAPEDPNYNRPVAHPYRASAERLWRSDRLYDVVLVLGYNDVPRGRGRGSAIFMHVARPGYAPTEGCIALAAGDLRRLLATATRRTRLRVLG